MMDPTGHVPDLDGPLSYDTLISLTKPRYVNKASIHNNISISSHD